MLLSYRSWIMDKIQDTLLCMDIRDIGDPFAIGLFCMEIPILQILIPMKLLSSLLPLSALANFRQQSAGLNKPANCFRISVTTVFVQPELHPAIAVCVFALLLPGDLVYNRLIWIWMVQIGGIAVVLTLGNAKEFVHPVNWILFPMTINHRIFHLYSHFLWTAENPTAVHSPFLIAHSPLL